MPNALKTIQARTMALAGRSLMLSWSAHSRWPPQQGRGSGAKLSLHLRMFTRLAGASGNRWRTRYGPRVHLSSWQIALQPGFSRTSPPGDVIDDSRCHLDPFALALPLFLSLSTPSLCLLGWTCHSFPLFCVNAMVEHLQTCLTLGEKMVRWTTWGNGAVIHR